MYISVSDPFQKVKSISKIKYQAIKDGRRITLPAIRREPPQSLAEHFCTTGKLFACRHGHVGELGVAFCKYLQVMASYLDSVLDLEQ